MIREIFVKTGLSKREAEVAELVATGLSNKEVASRLFVTEKTIKFHLTNIYKKMNLTSRTQLIVWSLPHMGFVDAAQPAPTRDQQVLQRNGALYGQQSGFLNQNQYQGGNEQAGGGNTSGGDAENQDQINAIPAGINPINKANAS